MHTHIPHELCEFRAHTPSPGFAVLTCLCILWEMWMFQLYICPCCLLQLPMYMWGRNPHQVTHAHLRVPACYPHLPFVGQVKDPHVIPGEDAQPGLGRAVMPWGEFWQDQTRFWLFFYLFLSVSHSLFLPTVKKKKKEIYFNTFFHTFFHAFFFFPKSPFAIKLGNDHHLF